MRLSAKLALKVVWNTGAYSHIMRPMKDKITAAVGPQRRDTQSRSFMSLLRSVKDRKVGVASGMKTLPHHRRRSHLSDVIRHVCQLTHNNVDYCRWPERSGTAARDLVSSTNKRVPSGDTVASIIDLCRSRLVPGETGNSQSACFDRYLKNFARRITTSGNKFVGRWRRDVIWCRWQRLTLTFGVTFGDRFAAVWGTKSGGWLIQPCLHIFSRTRKIWRKKTVFKVNKHAVVVQPFAINNSITPTRCRVTHMWHCQQAA